MTPLQRITLTFLKRVFGAPKTERDGVIEYEFNCRSARCAGQHKFNLAYNIDKNSYHCWSCKTKGSIVTLLKDYATKQEADEITTLLPERSKLTSLRQNKEVKQTKMLYLPRSYVSLSSPGTSKHYHAAMAYVTARGISMKQIKKNNIGYTEGPPYQYRIIIPSYDKHGNLNYYTGRAYYDWIKPNYMEPGKDYVIKADVIFNEYWVNFDIPVYLVEGVFDMLSLYNAVPLMGKVIRPGLLSKLKQHKSRVILCLDEDAIRDSLRIYNFLSEFGIDVYFVEVPRDIADVHTSGGREAIIKLVQTAKKLKLKNLMKLKTQDIDKSETKPSKEYLAREWDLIQKSFETA